jgi:hypothetical protein
MSKNFSMKLIPAAFVAMYSCGAMAVPLASPAVSGTTTIYLETSPGLVTVVANNPANLAAALSGPGNVQLGRFGAQQGALSGTLAGNPVTLSSLSQLDWTANGNALAMAYISGAATSIGAILTPVQMAQAVNVFLTTDINPGAAITYSWMLLSDPNVSDVNLVDGDVVVGLDGLLDAEPFLDAIFLPLGADAPDGSQASEVVKVSYMGKTEYLFGFEAVPTGYDAGDPNKSYSGRFVVPEPSAMWLLGIGLIGLLASRRR